VAAASKVRPVRMNRAKHHTVDSSTSATGYAYINQFSYSTVVGLIVNSAVATNANAGGTPSSSISAYITSMSATPIAR
jgi:hypothetical protein